MKLHDPKRPKNAQGLPLLVWKGKPAAIVPSANILMATVAKGKVDLAFHACYNQTTARYYRKLVPLKDVTKELEAFTEDPEKWLTGAGWKWEG